MKDQKVYITCAIPEKAILFLREQFNIEVNMEDKPLKIF